MIKSPHQIILNRSLELESGKNPDYEPVEIEHLASLDLSSSSKALHALKDLETMAWARAEYCLVRDIGRVLSGDLAFLDRCTANPVPEDPFLLQTKAQVLAFLANIVLGTLDAEDSSIHLTSSNLRS